VNQYSLSDQKADKFWMTAHSDNYSPGRGALLLHAPLIIIIGSQRPDEICHLYGFSVIRPSGVTPLFRQRSDRGRLRLGASNTTASVRIRHLDT
jgi:hypothetical protein